MKRKITTSVLFTLCFNIIVMSQNTLVDNYKDYSSEVLRFSESLNNCIDNEDMQLFTQHLEMGEKYKNYFLNWFEQIIAYKKGYKLDETEVYIPALGVKENQVFTGSGYIETFISNPDTSFVHRLKLPSLLIKRESGQLIITDQQPGNIMDENVLDIKKANFVVQPSLDKTIQVKANYEIENSTSADVNELRIYLRHPLVINVADLNNVPIVAQAKFGYFEGTPCCEYTFRFENPLKVNDKAQLTFKYKADYRVYKGRKPVGFSHNRAFVLYESGWYPQLHPLMGESMPYNMEIIVPNNHTATTSGIPINKTTQGNSTSFVYSQKKTGRPHIVWGNYKEIDIAGSGQGFSIWLPQDADFDEGNIKTILQNIFEEYSRILPKPNYAYSQKFVAVTRYGGYGPQGNVLLNDEYFTLNPTEDIEGIAIIAHELCHNWINSITDISGDLVLFLSEGLAEYYSAKCIEKISGRHRSDLIWKSRSDNHIRYAHRAVAPKDLNESVLNNDTYMYRSVVYNKGSYLFRELEKVIGEDNLMTLLKDLITSHKDREFTMSDLETAISQHDHSVKALFDSYINTSDLPDYRIIPVDEGEVFGKLKVVNQGDQSNTPVDIKAYNSNNEVVLSKVLDFSINKEFIVDFSGMRDVTRVEIDPEKYILEYGNDNTYPDDYVNAADYESIKSSVKDLFNSITNKDIDTYNRLLASKEENIKKEAREDLLAFIKSGRDFTCQNIENVRMNKTSGNVIETVFDIEIDLGRGFENLFGIVQFVNENGDWKFVRFNTSAR